MAKIAIISVMAGDLWGGSEELWAATAKEALKAGNEVNIFIYQHESLVRQVVQLSELGIGISYRSLPRQGRAARLKNLFQSERSILINQLSKFKPDVVFISQGATFDISEINSARVCSFLYASKIPYVVICHRNEDSIMLDSHTRLATRDIFSKAHSVMFVAEHNLEIARRQTASSIENGFVVRNPVNLTAGKIPSWPKARLLRMANVARLDVSYKGQDILLEALANEKWKARDWMLSFYGKGIDQDYLHRLTKHYGLGEKIHFAGHVKDIRQIWEENHLLVLPSRMEGTPLSLIEAMLCARASLVTDVGGNTEWVTHGKTGFVAEAATAKSVRNALEEVWKNRENLEIIGKIACKQALSEIDSNPGKTVLDHLVRISQKNNPSFETVQSTLLV